MRRRDFTKGIVRSAIAWPLAAHAQRSAMRVIGFLDGQSPNKHLMTAFRQALESAGYIEGINVTIEYRSAYGETDRLVSLAGDLVIRSVSVIVATCPLWVKSGHQRMSMSCPLYPKSGHSALR
jgi:putative ABC transport system substrate-binding protein